MTDIRARLNEAADHLDTERPVLGGATVPLLSQWLRTEAKCNAGDEIHDEDCTPEECVAIAALALAERILKETA